MAGKRDTGRDQNEPTHFSVSLGSHQTLGCTAQRTRQRKQSWDPRAQGRVLPISLCLAAVLELSGIERQPVMCQPWDWVPVKSGWSRKSRWAASLTCCGDTGTDSPAGLQPGESTMGDSVVLWCSRTRGRAAGCVPWTVPVMGILAVTLLAKQEFTLRQLWMWQAQPPMSAASPSPACITGGTPGWAKVDEGPPFGVKQSTHSTGWGRNHVRGRPACRPPWISSQDRGCCPQGRGQPTLQHGQKQLSCINRSLRATECGLRTLRPASAAGSFCQHQSYKGAGSLIKTMQDQQ